MRLPGLPIRLSGRNVPARHRRRNPGLRHHQIRCLRAAPGIPGHSDPRRVHLLPAHQIIHAANPVPDEIAGHVAPDQRALEPLVGMLFRAPRDSTFPAIRIPVLQPFSLSQRINRQHHEPVSHEVETHLLIQITPLGSLRVTAHKKHRRSLLGQPGRHIQIRSHVKTRLTLKHDFLDPVSFPLHRAHTHRLQRRFLLRQSSERVEKVRPNPRPTPLESLTISKTPLLSVLPRKIRLGLICQIGRQLILRVVISVCVGSECDHERLLW